MIKKPISKTSGEFSYEAQKLKIGRQWGEDRPGGMNPAVQGPGNSAWERANMPTRPDMSQKQADYNFKATATTKPISSGVPTVPYGATSAARRKARMIRRRKPITPFRPTMAAG